MSRCPLCSPVEAVEEPLLMHLLRDHPEAQAIAAILLPIGTALLARRPTGLLIFFGALMAVALIVGAQRRTG